MHWKLSYFAGSRGSTEVWNTGPSFLRVATNWTERQFSVGRRIRYDNIQNGSSSYTSDSDDSDFAAGSPDEPFYVVRVACENRGFLPKGCRHHNGVNDIRRFGHA